MSRAGKILHNLSLRLKIWGVTIWSFAEGSTVKDRASMRIGEVGTVILGFPFIECVTFGCKWVRKVFGATLENLRSEVIFELETPDQLDN